ncbi:PDR/VanB family oxidoreductase [Sphingomonas sp. CLY1604]|uniref:PDR/VanB family oxidoreductase n=1 Tax=Sphingomonas sp. CLY1604 TaxID=3457786 RepID=UPI003FD89F1E
MSIPVRLIRKTRLSADIAEFRFEPLEGRIAGLEPGAHVDLRLSDDLIRQYSLCDWDPDGAWLAVAVKREASGRGGSQAMHALVEGVTIELGGPRNHFALQDSDRAVLLIGGGIGATPILAMARHLAARSADFRLAYLTRTRDDAALDGAFGALGVGDAYRLHCDAADGLCDIDALIADHPADGHIYVCGPEPMLAAVLNAGERLKRPNIHFERFAAAPDALGGPTEAFEVRIASSGDTYRIGPGETILGVLRSANYDVEFGCSEGMCGSCIVNVLDGEVDHRDSVFQGDEREQNDYMCICVSRAKTGKLTLDL